jgi:predicted GIY-YIG superfamily endonuclease
VTEPVWHLYLLRCGEVLYTGITTDVEARVQAHAEGRGAKFTRGRTVELLFRRAIGSRSRASRMEAAVKRLSRAGKLAIIRGEAPLPDLPGDS